MIGLRTLDLGTRSFAEVEALQDALRARIIEGDPGAAALLIVEHPPVITLGRRGEDHALLATFPAGTALPDGFVAVGEALPAAEDGPGVLVDGAAYGGPAGHDHFR